jgi:hypothetical protein
MLKQAKINRYKTTSITIIFYDAGEWLEKWWWVTLKIQFALIVDTMNGTYSVAIYIFIILFFCAREIMIMIFRNGWLVNIAFI